MPEPGGPGGPLPPFHYLADQLTLFQPGKGRLSQPITAGPQKNFFHFPASLSYEVGLKTWTHKKHKFEL